MDNPLRDLQDRAWRGLRNAGLLSGEFTGLELNQIGAPAARQFREIVTVELAFQFSTSRDYRLPREVADYMAEVVNGERQP